MIDDFNTALADMKADGTYQAIMAKWLGTDDKATTSQATGDPTAKATPVKASYKIVSDSSFAPFEFQNDKGKYVGIDMELIKAIAKQQGFKIEIANPGFDAALNAVQSSQADGVIAGATITDARKAIFDFSDSYYTSNVILAVKKEKRSTVMMI